MNELPQRALKVRASEPRIHPVWVGAGLWMATFLMGVTFVLGLVISR